MSIKNIKASKCQTGTFKTLEVTVQCLFISNSQEAGLKVLVLSIFKFCVADFSFGTAVSSTNLFLLSVNLMNILWHLEVFAEHKQGMHRWVAGWHLVEVKSCTEASVIKVNAVAIHYEFLKVLVTPNFIIPILIKFSATIYLYSQQNKAIKTLAWVSMSLLTFLIYFVPLYLKANSVDISFVLEAI